VFLLENKEGVPLKESDDVVVGFGLISPLVLRYYGDMIEKGDLNSFRSHCVSMSQALLCEGYRVNLFPNGNSDDQDSAQSVFSDLAISLGGDGVDRCIPVPCVFIGRGKGTADFKGAASRRNRIANQSREAFTRLVSAIDESMN